MRPIHLVFAAAALVLTVLTAGAAADVLDPGSPPYPVLRDCVEALDGAGVDVLYSHESEAGRTEPSFGDRPRLAPLIGYQGWPGAMLDLDRYKGWLDAFEKGARGAIAAAPAAGEQTRPDREAFQRIWKDAPEGRKILITFDQADLEAAERIAGVLEEKGYAVYLAIAAPQREPLDPEVLGRLFVQADHCLVIETTTARLNGVIQFEADLLAELRRQAAWIESGADELPPVTRGSMDVIEALGVLPMKVLPGGIVLGVVPTLEADLAGAVPAIEPGAYGLDIDGQRIVLEEVSPETTEAIRAFAAVEGSHAVVDIAGNDVTLAEPFRNTPIGERLAMSDRIPFMYLSIEGAQKSLIVDQGIRLYRRGERAAADVTLEVRFYRRTDEGYADRLATLRFTVQDASRHPRVLDLAWSRRADSNIGFNGVGIGGLVNDMSRCARDAALIGLARLERSTTSSRLSGPAPSRPTLPPPP